jgi:hypothetical protein
LPQLLPTLCRICRRHMEPPERQYSAPLPSHQLDLGKDELGQREMLPCSLRHMVGSEGEPSEEPGGGRVDLRLGVLPGTGEDGPRMGPDLPEPVQRPFRAQNPRGPPLPRRRRASGSTSLMGTETETRRFSTPVGLSTDLALAILVPLPRCVEKVTGSGFGKHGNIGPSLSPPRASRTRYPPNLLPIRFLLGPAGGKPGRKSMGGKRMGLPIQGGR